MSCTQALFFSKEKGNPWKVLNEEDGTTRQGAPFPALATASMPHGSEEKLLMGLGARGHWGLVPTGPTRRPDDPAPPIRLLGALTRDPRMPRPALRIKGMVEKYRRSDIALASPRRTAGLQGGRPSMRTGPGAPTSSTATRYAASERYSSDEV